MDKKSIKTAIDDILLLRISQQQNLQLPLFKPNINPNEKDQLVSVMFNQDWKIPERVTDVIKNSLLNSGYKEGVQYSEEQTNQFALAVAQDLKLFISGFGNILSFMSLNQYLG